MNAIRLEYRKEDLNKTIIHEVIVQDIDLNHAWNEMVHICTYHDAPIPTEEDYKAGRLTKTIIQE